jgi:hypothetical protein
MQHIPLAFIRLQDVAPGLTDDKGCFDQTDVGSRSDHLLLMEERNGTMLDPQPPIADCLFERAVCDCDEVVFDADAPGQAEIEFRVRATGVSLLESRKVVRHLKRVAVRQRDGRHEDVSIGQVDCRAWEGTSIPGFRLH